MNLKELYFKTRNASLADDDRSKLAEREIKTIEIFQEMCGVKMIEHGTNILDLGAGDKHLQTTFEKRGMLYKGLDIEDLDLEKDLIDEDDNSFDFVTSYSVIEHLHDPQNFLLESKRVLKTGKALLIETPNWHYSYKTFYNDFTHVRPYCPDSLKRLALANGFTSVFAFPNLRCKPKFFYNNSYAFKIASKLPFTGDASHLIPDIFKGKSLGMFVIAIK